MAYLLLSVHGAPGPPILRESGRQAQGGAGGSSPPPGEAPERAFPSWARTPSTAATPASKQVLKKGAPASRSSVSSSTSYSVEPGSSTTSRARLPAGTVKSRRHVASSAERSELAPRHLRQRLGKERHPEAGEVGRRRRDELLDGGGGKTHLLFSSAMNPASRCSAIFTGEDRVRGPFEGSKTNQDSAGAGQAPACRIVAISTGVRRWQGAPSAPRDPIGVLARRNAVLQFFFTRQRPARPRRRRSRRSGRLPHAHLG